MYITYLSIIPIINYYLLILYKYAPNIMYNSKDFILDLFLDVL